MRSGWGRLRKHGGVDGGRGMSRGGLDLGGGALGFVVEEVEAATEAERVVLGFIKGLALGLGPEGFWVLWHCRSWRGRCRVAEEGVGFHPTELGSSIPCPPRWEGKGSMAPLVDGHSYAVEDYCLAVPGLCSRHHVSGQVMETGCSRGEGVSLAVKFFSDGADEPKVDADVT